MPAIRKSADLRNAYSEISEFCHKYREPVFITKNGAGDLAVMSIETYEEITGRRELYKLLEDGINDIKNGNILTEEEMDRSLDLM
ncbi:prevent-host-death protein [Spirochaetia bacterium]|nr:prevent-host-death protein [Spirochaetia bacterium]GHU71628.1 prevent-host-death protein [Spirochaetia bacterium]GHU96921.1 prevent-host-death protein [Spirochaetia bacterium]GHV93654.1 prevent-host-death protein [Spirochaetia bacterium]